MLKNVKMKLSKKYFINFAENYSNMKKLASNLIRFSALLLAIIFITSCNPKNRYTNYFQIGEEIHEIASGVIINKGETEGGFDLDLRLYDASGTNFVNFGITSEQAESIIPKTYTDFEGTHVLGYKDGSYTSMTSMNTGSIVIDRNEDGYLISFQCTDQYSEDVKGHFKGKLSKMDENNLVKKLPVYILPDAIYDEVTELIPIYSGVNPPDMEGEYISSPHALIYESYSEKPDSLQFYSDRYLGFIYANKQMNFYGKQYDSLEQKYFEEIQYGVKITGDDDYFSCYYVVDGYVDGFYAQQSFIFSGKKTEAGLEDFHVAVILLENSGNPNMFEKHSYRVLKDYDGLAETNYWLSGKSGNNKASSKINNSFDIWMK